MKKIKVYNHGNLPTAFVEDFQELQEDFKLYDSDKNKKLQKIIIDRGFKYAFKAWQDKTGKLWIIDAHQRKIALIELQANGYKIPPIPYEPIQALTKKEAVEEIAAYNSEFGKRNYETTLFEKYEIDTGDLEKFSLKMEPEKLDFEKEGKQELEAKEDNYQVPDEIETDIILGDLFEIGEHRLLCGDSKQDEQIKKLINNSKIGVIFTDPPYGVNYTNNKRVSGSEYKRKSTYDKIENDNLKPADFENFISIIIKNANSVLDDNSVIYLCASDKPEYRQSYENACEINKLKFSSYLIWDKGNFGFGFQNYRAKHEGILYYKKGKPEKNWIGGKDKSTILQINKDPNKEYNHPTQKPVMLSHSMIKNHDYKNVCDLFGGSGSTLVAIHQLKRKGFIMELNPKYCQVIINRMLALDPDLIIKKNGKKYTAK